MDRDEVNVSCSDCGADLPADSCDPGRSEVPCRGCGAVRRLVQVAFTDEFGFSIRETFGMKVRRQGSRRPVLEEVSGDDWSRSREKWVQLDRVVDRENDRYTEHVVDPDTGEVIHACDEPLSQHRGHGSARKRIGEAG